MESAGCSNSASPAKDPRPTSPSEGSEVAGYPAIQPIVYATLDRLLELNGADVNNSKDLKKSLLLNLARNDTRSIVPMALDFKNEKRLLHLDIMISDELYDMDIWLATYFAVTLDLEYSLKKLREFFEDEFTYRSDLTPDGTFVNRIYIFENYAKFNALPMLCRHFIFKCMMSAPTNMDYVDLEPNWRSPYPRDEGMAPAALKGLDRVLEKDPEDPERQDFARAVLIAMYNRSYPEAGMITTLLWSNLNTARDLLDFNDELASGGNNGLMLLFIVYRMNRLDSAFTLQHLQVIVEKLRCHFHHQLSRDCEDRIGCHINRTFYLENQQFFEAMPTMCYDYFVSLVLEVATSRKHIGTFLDCSNLFTRDIREFSFL